MAAPRERDRSVWPRGEGRWPKFLRKNGLSVAALLLFLGSFIGQALTGFHVANEQARVHHDIPATFGQYLASGDFMEAVFENWESEFLQIALFVVLTKFLRQRGSSESKATDGPSDVDEDPNEKRGDPNAPWPVRRGGIVLALYQRSLSLALLFLFALSFALHAVGGASKYNEEQLRHGGEVVTTFVYVGTAQFWFESFQNWQSEFFSIACLVLLSIVLRERGSPQSKPVAAPHSTTGGG
ncbi:DUF6766 family protein [Pendulispora rubella]|uniref:DUF6766 family protein n=1 Tax=Pendulispora rubella TaxID=2741070 RepID=UPI0030E5CD8A